MSSAIPFNSSPLPRFTVRILYVLVLAILLISHACSFVPSAPLLIRSPPSPRRRLASSPSRRRLPPFVTSLLASDSSHALPYPVRVAVLGGGNFALALASTVARNGVGTTLLVRDAETAASINSDRRHPRYMSDLALPPAVSATADPEVALKSATYIIHAVPVQYSRAFLRQIASHVPPHTPVLSASKGIETTSLGFMNEILEEELGTEREYAFLSGPSFAREIMECLATAVVVASTDKQLASDLADLLSSPTFRVFTSSDVTGVEVGGSVKNVIAISSGICEGLNLGMNAQASLVTRGCAEMRRLGLYMGAEPSTLAGLSGVGDTFGTCFGPLSRNRAFGVRLGKGETMAEILADTNEVAEGVDTAFALVDLIKGKSKGYRLDLKYPIIFGVRNILEGKLDAREGLEGIMGSPMRHESYEQTKECIQI
mmetsp:Transcript_18400/g.36769  ORF Transcript_18400/g.36769 Transcript_18400/m.36769 type:complete len:429 (-) Transcript_18400:9-1295(-)